MAQPKPSSRMGAADIRAQAPLGCDADDFVKRVQRLQGTLPAHGAIRRARLEITKERSPGLTGKALEAAADGVSLQQQIQNAKKENTMADGPSVTAPTDETTPASAEEKPKPKATKPKAAKAASNGGERSQNITTCLEAAVAVLKAAKDPLSRKEIEARCERKGVASTSKQSIAAMVNEAQVGEREIKGHRITRPGRGVYTVEKVA